MQIKVVKNAKRNILFGSINKAIVMLCPFVQRTIIQILLGAQYLGLSSLFTSILSVLSLAELGFNSAVVYNMYKPAAEGQVDKVNALLNFYRKAYRVIGLVVIVIGALMIPFLPKLIKGTYPDDINITWLYLIYLGNSAISYFLYAYMTSILVVHQRDDVQSSVNSVVTIFLTAAQAAVLLITRNYYLFVVMMLISTCVNNLWVAWRVHRLYPQYKPEGQIDQGSKTRIRKLVAGTFIQRACAVTRNSLDSICISAFLGLALTAMYNNYYLIIHGVTTLMGVIGTAFMGGVGNHIATKTVEENFREMQNLDFVYLWIGGWCSVCLVCLYQPFMQLWMGKEMMLDFPTVVLLVTYFYMLKLGDVRTLYSSGLGLWWEQRYRSISETVLNLVLNIVLGILFGIKGIVSATIVSLFLCNYLWSTRITFEKYFTIPRQKQYYTLHAKMTAVMIASACLTYFICEQIQLSGLIATCIVRLLICTITPNALYMIVFRETNEMIYMKKVLLKRFNQRIRPI